MEDGIMTYVGVDWAAATHYAYALDTDGRKLGHKPFPHSGEGLTELVEWIRSVSGREPGRIAIGIEVPHGPVVEHLMDAGFLVHAINPKQLDRMRDRFTMAGAKDDRLDAYVLADSLRTCVRLVPTDCARRSIIGPGSRSCTTSIAATDIALCANEGTPTPVRYGQLAAD